MGGDTSLGRRRVATQRSSGVYGVTAKGVAALRGSYVSEAREAK